MKILKTEEVKVKHPEKAGLKFENSLSPETLSEGVSVLMKLIQKRMVSEKKRKLFNDDAKPIILQLETIKIPVLSSRNMQLRFELPHPLISADSDVCLITSDDKRARRNDHEPSLTYYEALLAEKEVTGIKQVIPVRQLLNEHKAYEEKGRLAFLYDAYLVDSRVMGEVSKIVGSRFFGRGKHLMPVKFDSTTDIQKAVQRALTKTVMTLHCVGDTYSVKVADSSFTEDQIKDNVNAVIYNLENGLFPGGFANIRSLYLKTPQSLAIPIYLTLKSANTVATPIVVPDLPRACKDVKGELSTFVGGEVLVKPSGEVKFRKRYTEEDRLMGYKDGLDLPDELGDDNEEVSQPSAKKAPKGKKRKKDEDTSDDDVEDAENAYLSEWQKDFDAEGVEQPTTPDGVEGKSGEQPATKKQDKSVSKPTASKKTVVTKSGKSPAKTEPKIKKQALGNKSKTEQSPAPSSGKKQKRKADESVPFTPNGKVGTETTMKGKAKKQKREDLKLVSENKGPQISTVKKVKAKKQKLEAAPKLPTEIVPVVPVVVKKEKDKKVPIVASKGPKLNRSTGKKDDTRLETSRDALVNELLRAAVTAVATPKQNLAAKKVKSKKVKAISTVATPPKVVKTEKEEAGSTDGETPSEKEKKNKKLDDSLNSAITAIATPTTLVGKKKAQRKESVNSECKQALVDDLLRSAMQAAAMPPVKKAKKSKENKATAEIGGVTQNGTPLKKKPAKAGKKVGESLAAETPVLKNGTPLKKKPVTAGKKVGESLAAETPVLKNGTTLKKKPAKAGKKVGESLAAETPVLKNGTPLKKKPATAGKKVGESLAAETPVLENGTPLKKKPAKAGKKVGESLAMETPVLKKGAAHKGVSPADSGKKSPKVNQAVRYSNRKL